MKKILKIIVALFLGIVMILGVVGCNTDTQTDLQSKIDELQAQVEEFQSQIGGMEDRLAEKEEELRERNATIDDLNDQIKERDERIEQLEEQLNDLKDKGINCILEISSDKKVYSKGEEIYIDITFKNLSGADIEFAYYMLFWPDSSTGEFPEIDLAPPVTMLFKKDEVMHSSDRLGGCFPVGQHELKYKAIFYLEWEMTEYGYLKTDNRVEVWSNTIEFSVTDTENAKPGSYSLQTAYDRGLLTRKDLEKIAYYYNDYSLVYPQPLDKQIEKTIKEMAAEEMRNQGNHSIPEATAEDFTIVSYYGTYSGCYVLSMDNIYVMYPAVVVDYWEEIGGVAFHHTSHYKPEVWKLS